jgi:preprotein translocase subunit SecF
MTDKRRLRYNYKHLKRVKPAYLVLLAVFFLALGIYGLRQNYSEMVRLRTAVATADKENGDVETSLRNLRDFVYNHMNTNLSSGNVSIKPPVQLKYRYERLIRQEQARADNVNRAVKKQGERVCRAKYPSGIYNNQRVSCVAAYIHNHSIKPNPIPEELYKFDFVSPPWSADLAGTSLLLFMLTIVAIIIRLALGYWYDIRLED